jgi:hypothetical protein
MSTAPSSGPAGVPDATESRISRYEKDVTGSWLFHDMVVYGGIYVTMLLASVPAGAGWDVLIAAAPTVGMSLLRRILGSQV